MTLAKLCRNKNAYVVTNYSGNNIIRPEKFVMTWKTLSQPRIKISVNTDISVIGFYGNIGNIGGYFYTYIGY